jgi:hypothetical protein
MKDQTISVTQDHIQRGTREDSTQCPISLAIMEQIPGVTYAQSNMSSILFEKGEKGFVSDHLPESVDEFIFAYDRDDKGWYRPFEFTFTYKQKYKKKQNG